MRLFAVTPSDRLLDSVLFKLNKKLKKKKKIILLIIY